ncbi:hypothetical protein GCK72_016777 [Caenorhabditis remanei]|uniref:Uncharacterized protein n=1 Tax=Caenorhabditis remanei TaxID=31234 RepID=A0A6A5G5J4_CAERE|nr:hypothetical protein GCK72_016777 [Caenorhabditis remanei]KAF1750230.1 hypothetical protein GCK72_016777 [Caenorhabditis remanei]
MQDDFWSDQIIGTPIWVQIIIFRWFRHFLERDFLLTIVFWAWEEDGYLGTGSHTTVLFGFGGELGAEADEHHAKTAVEESGGFDKGNGKNEVDLNVKALCVSL